jgi:hypothetical protein
MNLCAVTAGLSSPAYPQSSEQETMKRVAWMKHSGIRVKLSVWWKKNREKFFFGEGSVKPACYVPPQEENI